MVDDFVINPSSFDKEVMEAVPRAVWHSSFLQQRRAQKLIQRNERIARKEMAEYFGVSPRIIQRYMNLVKSVRYVGSGKFSR